MTINKRGLYISKTPLRVSFFGGGTDMPDYFNRKKGAVLGVGINRYLYVTVNKAEKLLTKKFRISYAEVEQVNSVDEIQHPIVRETIKYLNLQNTNSFLDIHSYSDIPSGTGTGSSSSFCVGLLHALNASQGIFKTPSELAQDAIKIEREILGEKGGWQDQIFAAYGGLMRINFSHHSYYTKPIIFSPGRLQLLERSIVLFYLNTQRSSAVIQEQVFSDQNIHDKELKLDKLYDLVNEAEEAIYSSAKLSDNEFLNMFGGLLDKGWALKKGMSTHISNSVIDTVYERAKEAGALGGKLCGAGGSGFLMLIIPESKKSFVKKQLCEYNSIDIGFDHMGSVMSYARQLHNSI